MFFFLWSAGYVIHGCLGKSTVLIMTSSGIHDFYDFVYRIKKENFRGSFKFQRKLVIIYFTMAVVL